MWKSAWLRMLCMQSTIAASAQVFAQSPSDADFCREGSFPREQESLNVGVIRGQKDEKVHFFDDLDGCPAKGATCMRASYLVPGDEILVGKHTADWACVWYQGRKNPFVAWVPKKNVAVLPASPVRQGADWAGIWVYGPDRIRISSTKRKGELRMRSNLRWEGGILPNGEALAHFGGMTGTLDIDGSRASAAEGECRVGLTRIGRYLVADDNGACGALNVRHTGMYVRQSK